MSRTTTPSLTAAEAVAARQTLGLSTEALAAELGLTPHVVQAWEAGSIRVPKRYAEQLAWRVAAAARQEALATSGLPECEWVAAWEEKVVPDSLKRRAKHFDELSTHATSCATCQARETYIAERFPPMPAAPLPYWMRGLAWIAGRIERLPRWARPAATGALLFGAWSLFRILLSIPAITATPGGWLPAAGGLAASMALGAALGLLYGGVRELRLRRPRART